MKNFLPTEVSPILEESVSLINHNILKIVPEIAPMCHIGLVPLLLSKKNGLQESSLSYQWRES